MNDPLSQPLEASDRKTKNRATMYLRMFFFCEFEKVDNVWKNYLRSEGRQDNPSDLRTNARTPVLHKRLMPLTNLSPLLHKRLMLLTNLFP